MKSVLRLGVALLLLAPSAAFANDYISTNPGDWYRYVDSRTGQELRSELTRDLGGWRQWSNWGGMGSTWVYTSDDHDYFWLWNGTTYQLMANLDGQIGESRNVQLDCNAGAVTILSQGALSTAAGDFPQVTRLGLTSSCADAGVTSIWFAKGVGIVKWAEQSFMGERTYELASAMVGGQTLPAATAPASTTTTSSGPGFTVAPAEHDRMEAILWGANDTYLVLDTYMDAFPALDQAGVPSQVIVSSQSVASELRYEMAQANVSLDRVEIFVAALDSVWIRDYGPIILKRPDGTRVVADLEYYYNRRQDNAFPAAYAAFRGWDRVKVNVSFEGGAFACDGQGLQLSTFGAQWFNDDMSTSQIEREFQKLGTRQMVWVEPLVDEGTTHIDMFARIMGDGQALVSRYPSSHRQSRVVNAAAARLRGLGYDVTRVDVDTRYDEFGTYSNSTLANGVALVPQYEDRTKNLAALDAYAALGYDAYGIDSKLIIKYAGATHCVSMQVPAGR